jgi:hypothetical protein
MTWATAHPGRWHLGIAGLRAGDWVIVGAYAAAFVLAVVAACVAGRAATDLAGHAAAEAHTQRVLRRVWVGVAVVLLALGINRQLDVQTWLIQTLRRHAYEGGWYDRRREYQAAVIGAILVAALVVGAVLAVVLRRVLRRIALVMAGLVGLTAFVGIRAISFHDVDHLLAVHRGAGDAIELGGIVVVVVATLIWWRRERQILGRAMASPPPPASLREPVRSR